METLKVTLVQPDIIWERATANLEHYSEMLADVDETDVIVLPEMFTTGFSMYPEKLKESMAGPSVEWMKNLAREKNAVVTGSLIIDANDEVYNRCLWVFPEGKTEYYDKRHLFTMSGEHLQYAAGSKRLVVEYKGWRFCPLVCYDLRFPVWSRNTVNYDVLLYVANWPAPRHHAWKSLLVARAIENQAYCVGINRIGKDGNGLDYQGDSALVDPKGFASFLGEKEQVKTFELSYSGLQQFRKKFPVLEDGDSFTLDTPNSPAPD
ncbi:amidohydrolase [Mariniphaga sediminis]|uniref:Omega-amidase YafV n=1 Tax=Mariniphaga sediminis TaxID=1628158 RepID=A0A399D571_9BACT|nr:amidohydrolase [Mariniphaga sediminis]RIH64294.1 amidohydrolase [Mariniphaga sediminis]RIH66573.1 amidohydrolase [Mariniphaga sediminis]